jgi:hypothetical protein
LLSSAILYVAIVAIWACVLIPRWLKRDSSSAASDADTAGSTESRDLGAEDLGAVDPGAVDLGAEDLGVGEEPAAAFASRRRERRVGPGGRVAGGRVAGDPPAGEPGHRRVLAARRRLLIMLVALTVASGVLAGARMAAWWVIVPPSVMLLGYLLMLREAAKADAERREMARHLMARETAERRSAPVAHATPAVAVPVPVAAAASAAPAPAPAAKIIAFLPPPEEQIYDQYMDAKLRAVGD